MNKFRVVPKNPEYRFFVDGVERPPRAIDVYDVRYDSSGYPHFLIYQNEQWLQVSAKHFRPIS